MPRTTKAETMNANVAEQGIVISDISSCNDKILEVREKALTCAGHILDTIDVPTNETQVQALKVAIELLREAKLPY